MVVTPFDGRLDRIRRRRASLASVIERLALCPDAGSGVALIALRADTSATTDAAAARQRPLEAAAVADVHDRRGRELFGLCRRLGLDDDEANDAVIYLRYRADLTYERIARVMGITANGARNDASAATATLRKRYLSEEGLR